MSKETLFDIANKLRPLIAQKNHLSCNSCEGYKDGLCNLPTFSWLELDNLELDNL
jgi:hypothetical protein